MHRCKRGVCKRKTFFGQTNIYNFGPILITELDSTSKNSDAYVWSKIFITELEICPLYAL